MAPASATAPAYPSAIFSASSLSLSRLTTRDGSDSHGLASEPASKDRNTSFSSRKASFPGTHHRGTWTAPTSSNGVVTDAAVPPALPDYTLAAAAKITLRDKDMDKDKLGVIDGHWSPGSPKDSSNMLLNRPATAHMLPSTPVEARPAISGPPCQLQSEAHLIHQQMTEVAQKRISTLDYLRRAHEGRIYWFNTYLFDKPDICRMPGFDPRRLARKATNHLLLGLSIPTINDLYSSTPLEFLRCLNSLLSEFDSFQQLHGDSSAASSLSRARIPNMFRRPGTKSRHSTPTSADAVVDDSSSSAFSQSTSQLASANGGSACPAPSVMNFAASESDLLPGEEYTYLLTPSLPFDPDFFETFATLCDVLIDCYMRILALVPTPRECSTPLAELFTKADSKMRKIIVQGVVKDFEDHSRARVKSEVAGIGKVVLGGLM